MGQLSASEREPLREAGQGKDYAQRGPADGAEKNFARRKQNVQIWLACVAFYYPFFWLANSLISAVPALARAALFGYRLDGIRLNFFGAFASNLPPAGEMPQHWVARAGFASATDLVLVIAVAILLAWLGKRALVLSGFALAVLASVGFATTARRLLEFRQVTVVSALCSVILFVSIGLGQRWMLAGFAAGPATVPDASGSTAKGPDFFSRLTFLLAGSVFPPALLWAGFSLARGFEVWIFALMLAGPACLAAILASAWPASAAAVPQRMNWSLPLAGVVATVILLAGVRAGEVEMARARDDSTRAALAAFPELSTDAPYPKLFFQKGVSVSAEGWGGYESASAREMLKRLKANGVNAVALVPYGFAPRGRAEIRLNTSEGSWESDEGLAEMSRVAHALGMKVLLKPGVWVGSGGYAGDLDFASPADRAQWFESYGRFLDHYAQLATRIHADVFCVGGEFVKLTPYEADWRKLIARARLIYPGPLVYAANFGDEFERIEFWDALDYIGLQDYYPLPDSLATDDIVRRVEAVQKKYQRPVIFTEVGFASGEAPNRQPWEDGRGTPSPELQARCYEAVFKAFYDRPWFEGMYWWKVGTNGFGGPDDTSLTPWGKPAMDVIKRWYSRPDR